MKTQDKIKYSIRLNNLTENQRKSLSLLLHTRIEDINNQNNNKETNNIATKIKNIDNPEKHLEELVEREKFTNNELINLEAKPEELNKRNIELAGLLHTILHDCSILQAQCKKYGLCI